MSARLLTGLASAVALACGQAEPELAEQEEPAWLVEAMQSSEEERLARIRAAEEAEPAQDLESAPLLVPGQPPLAPEPEPELGSAEDPEDSRAGRVAAARREAAMIGALSDMESTAVTRSAPAWAFDPEAAFTVSFGRGSGRSGLSVVDLDETGEARVSRWVAGPSRAFTWRIQLEPAAVRRALAALAPTEFKNRYREPYVVDGSQWVLQVRQGGRQHVVYCDNMAPARLQAFARTLDEWIPRAIDPALGARLPAGTRVDEALWAAQAASPNGKVLGSEPRAFTP